MRALSMIGIRLDKLEPSQRKLFDFSEERLSDATVRIRRKTASKATILICTCDRLEIWCEENAYELVEPSLRELSLSPLAWKKHVYTKEGKACVSYLFTLACGLLSPLFGEDQIISQLTACLNRSRIIGCSSFQFEQLFRKAVTLAKKVQTQLDLGVADTSVAYGVQSLLAKHYGALEGKPVLVIGSSALARLVSEVLVAEKMQVYMTIRDKEKADLLLPKKVLPLSYEQRFSVFSQVDVVISATKGQYYTVKKSEAKGPSLYIDLANPFDIEPEIGDVEGIRRYTTDDLECSLPQREHEVEKAMEFIVAGVEDFFSCLATREALIDIQQISTEAAKDLVYRLHDPVSKLGLEPDEKHQLMKTLTDTARKAFSHQLFETKKHQDHGAYLDLSRPLVSGPPTYPGDPETEVEEWATLEENHYRLKRLSFGTHSFTHMDSPYHILKEGKSLDRYPVSSFFARAYVLDCRDCRIIDRVMVQDLKPDVEALLFCTGWEHYWGDVRYLDTPPQLSLEAVSFLLEKGVRIFGFDAPSCDDMEKEGLPIHTAILSKEGLILENLCNLEALVDATFTLIALPLSVQKSDGSPVRVVASFS